MSMYNLIGYSDNYSDTSRRLWQFKREESPVTDAGNPDNLTVDNSPSLKYKSRFLKEKKITEGQTRVSEDAKIAVPLKYLDSIRNAID